MPGACPTWTKWVGQAHLARFLFQEALLLESGLCGYSGAAGSLSSSRKKSFPGGPAGKHLIILDSLLSSSVQDGGIWEVRVTAVVDGIDESGFKWYFLFDLLIGLEKASVRCWCVGPGIPS